MFNIFDWLSPNKNTTAVPVQPSGQIRPNSVILQTIPQVTAKYTNLHPECLDNLDEDSKYLEASKKNTNQADELALFVKHYYNNENLYKTVGLQADVPAILVGAIHWREASGSFKEYLSQGDPLGMRTYANGDSNNGHSLSEGTPDTILFPDTIDGWIQSAVFALKKETRARQASGIGYDEENVNDMLTYAMYYNGLGYQYRKVPDPYIYACTSCYTKGKFDDDGHFNANDVDKQLGVLIMLRSLINKNTLG